MQHTVQWKKVLRHIDKERIVRIGKLEVCQATEPVAIADHAYRLKAVVVHVVL